MTASSRTAQNRPKEAAPAPREAAGPQSQAVQLKSSLRGQPYDVQMRMLEPVQQKGQGGTQGVHEAAEMGVSGGGGSLPHGDKIQQAFGRHDVGAVQAHTGDKATKANDAMGAQAYATGNNIAFKGAPDLHTAAHEAAHVVQQRSGVQLSGGVGKSGDGYEQHADAVADKVVKGESAEGVLDKMAGGGGGGVQKSVQRKGDLKEADAQTTAGTANPVKAQDKTKVATDSVDSPTAHPMFPTFEARVKALFSQFPAPPGVDLKVLTINIWSQVCGGVKDSATEMKRDGSNDTYSNPSRGWVNMESAGFKKALTEFESVMGTLKSVTQAQFMKAKTFGFWSKSEGRMLGEKMVDLTLETSGIGALFDGMPSLDAHANGWDPQLWGSLSKAFGESVAVEMTKKGKTVHVFAGGGTDKTNIFGAIESKALEKGAARIGKTLEEAVTFHSVAAVSQSKREPDTNVKDGDVPGTWYSGHSWDTALDTGKTKFAQLPA